MKLPLVTVLLLFIAGASIGCRGSGRNTGRPVLSPPPNHPYFVEQASRPPPPRRWAGTPDLGRTDGDPAYPTRITVIINGRPYVYTAEGAMEPATP